MNLIPSRFSRLYSVLARTSPFLLSCCRIEPSRPLTCNPTFSSFSRCKVSWWSCQPSRQEGDGDGVKIFAPTLWRTCKWTYGDPSGLVCGDHILQFSQGDRQGLLLNRLAAYPRPPVPISRPEYTSAGVPWTMYTSSRNISRCSTRLPSSSPTNSMSPS